MWPAWVSTPGSIWVIVGQRPATLTEGAGGGGGGGDCLDILKLLYFISLFFLPLSGI